MPWWLYLIGGLACGVLAVWLVTWQWRIRRRVIAAGPRVSGTVLAVKPGDLAGQWPSYVASSSIVVRYTWQGTEREEGVVLRATRSAAAYHPDQTVDLALDPTRADRVVLVDGGGQTVGIGPIAILAGMTVAVIAVALLARFLIAVH